MAFEGLSSKLQNIFKKLGNRGKLTEKEVKEAMRELHRRQVVHQQRIRKVRWNRSA